MTYHEDKYKDKAAGFNHLLAGSSKDLCYPNARISHLLIRVDDVGSGRGSTSHLPHHLTQTETRTLNQTNT